LEIELTYGHTSYASLTKFTIFSHPHRITRINVLGKSNDFRIPLKIAGSFNKLSFRELLPDANPWLNSHLENYQNQY